MPQEKRDHSPGGGSRDCRQRAKGSLKKDVRLGSSRPTGAHRCTQVPKGIRDVPDAALDDARAEAGEGLARKIPLPRSRP